MNLAEDFAFNCKMVSRYLKPLLYNLNSIYIDAELVRSQSGNELIFITRQDGEEIPIIVTGKTPAEIVKTVLNELF